MRFYLAGAITFAQDPDGWREKITQNVDKHTFCNPLDIKVLIGDKVMDKTQLKQLLSEYSLIADNNNSFINSIRDIGLCIINDDILKLMQCDGLILYDNGDQMWGSICEAFTAFQLGKPIYMVTTKKPSQLSTWSLAITDMMFYSIDELISYLNGQ